MNECFYYRVIKNWLKASLVLLKHTRQLKEDDGKTKNAERYGVSAGKLQAIMVSSLEMTICLAS